MNPITDGKNFQSDMKSERKFVSRYSDGYSIGDVAKAIYAVAEALVLCMSMYIRYKQNEKNLQAEHGPQ